MLPSKKNDRVEESKGSKVQDRVAKGIAGFLLSVQNRFASFMSRRINNLNIGSRQLFLALFCLLFGGSSFYSFFGAFRDTGNAGKAIKPDQLRTPKYYDQTGSEAQESPISEKNILRINRFKKYMDSLSQTAKGRHLYDSILKARPHLMDSIKIIEEIYYSQSK